MILLALETGQSHEAVLVEVEVILCGVGPYPILVLSRGLRQLVDRITQPSRLEALVCLVVVVDTEVSLYDQVLDRLNLQVGVTEHTPILILVGRCVLDQTHSVRGIAQDVVDLIHIDTLYVIHGLGGMLLHGVLLDAARHVVRGPPVHGHIATRLQAVVEEAIVGAETRVETFEVGALHDTIVI